MTATRLWALADQVLSSVTNFATGIAVARTIGPAGYGSFTLAFGSWVVLLGATRSMLVQPYTVSAAGASDAEWREATGSTAAGVLVFGVLFGGIAVVAGAVQGFHTATGGAFAALGLFAPALALQDFWRFAAFSRMSPRGAAANDGAWAIVQAVSLAALIITHSVTPATAVASWGLGALAGALLGPRQFRVRPSLGAAERQFIRCNAKLAGWFGVANASFQAGSYGVLLLIGESAGRVALGGLSSARNLMSPAQLVVSSAESIMLPMAAKVARTGHDRSLRVLCKEYSLAVGLFLAACGGALVLVGPYVLGAVFGAGYVRFAGLVLPVAAAIAVSGFASGFVVGIRSLGAGRTIAGLQFSASVARIAITIVSLPFGILAIAWGLAFAELFRTILAWLMFSRALIRRS